VWGGVVYPHIMRGLGALVDPVVDSGVGGGFPPSYKECAAVILLPVQAVRQPPPLLAVILTKS
jgi:hypothetical protein